MFTLLQCKYYLLLNYVVYTLNFFSCSILCCLAWNMPDFFSHQLSFPCTCNQFSKSSNNSVTFLIICFPPNSGIEFQLLYQFFFIFFRNPPSHLKALCPFWFDLYLCTLYLLHNCHSETFHSLGASPGASRITNMCWILSFLCLVSSSLLVYSLMWVKPYAQ